MMMGTIGIFLAEALILPTGFITAVFLARSLGPVGYGLFALVSRLVIWIEWSSTAGFASTTIKFVGEAKDWKPIGATVVKLHLMMGISTAILLWLLSWPISRMFNEPAMAEYLRLFAIDIPIFSLACANINILVGMGRFKERARTSAGRLITRLVLIILFVEMGLSVKGAILGSIGASVVELIISWFYTRPNLFYKATFPIRRLLGFGAPLFMSGLSLRIFRLDLFALKVLGGTAAQAGFYGAAMNLSIPPAIFSTSLSPPLLSTLSGLLSEGDDAKAKKIGMMAMRSVLWFVPFAAMTAGAASEIVCFIFGEKYLPAGPILAFLIFASLGLISINIAKAILTALGRPGWTFILTGPMVPLALIGYVAMIPWLGGVGAAGVTTAIACLVAVISVYAVYRFWKVLPPARTLLNSTFCSGVALALAALWPVSDIIIILKIMVIILIILFTFLLLGEFTSSEINLVRSMLRWRFGRGQSKGEI